MATIDYKQKIKDYMNSSEVDTLYKSMLNNLFPELKESEDLRIIKAIKYGLDHVFTNNTTVFEVTKEQCLSWLEKQGEHANFRNKIQIGDKLTRNEDGVLVNLSQLNRVAKKDEKQGEQKPVDKVEPKFRKGDWVVYCNDDVDLITGVEENGYSINNDGYIPFICESDVRLWTIQDAKDGDVLATDGGVCIFDGTLEDGKYPFAYCGITKRGF